MYRPQSDRLQAIKIHKIKFTTASSFLYEQSEISRLWMLQCTCQYETLKPMKYKISNAIAK